MRVTCNSCHGIYETVSRDGLPYTHVCPPLRGMRVKVNGVESIIPYDPKFAGGVVLDDAVAVPRTSARDERPDLTKKPIDGVYPVVSDGLGVTETPAAAVPLVGF